MNILRKLQTFSRVLRKLGILAALRLFIRKILCLTKPNSFDTFNPAGMNVDISPKEAVVLFSRTDPARLELYVAEFEEYMRSFELRLKNPRSTFFEEIFDLGPNMAQFLYLWIRSLQPFSVIETGVAAGASSNTILSALEKNGHGRLESIDITSRVGELIERRLKIKWNLHVINPKNGSKSVDAILRNNNDSTVFLHDSDHSSEWQIIEFVSATTHLPKNSLIAFDDVSNALIKYVQLNFPEMKIIIFDENAKYSAIFRRT